ncbi:hypothetical protein SEA_NICKY22_65 [Microbacterium phage Nicky22]|nr:hypothetical protein SEA_NICKY22_65 [Microbacterium phage Nicky22]
MSALTNIIKRKPATPLVDQLDAKRQELEEKAESDTASAAALSQAAAEAARSASEATSQADAVYRANVILVQAGVTL